MHKQSVSIRRVGFDEGAALQYIVKATFVETFGAVNSQASIDAYAASHLTLNAVQLELEARLSQFFFAEIRGKVVGYLKLNFGTAQTESLLANAMEIERIYALASCHGKGVGQEIYAKAIECAQAAKLDWVWLGVWEENSRAIRFYEKNGFVPFDTHVFHLGSEAQMDVLMRKKLSL